MWKRGRRSTALERAEALLLTRKRPTNTDPAVKTKSVSPKALTSDLNDLSVTSDSEEGVGVLGSTDTQNPVEGGRSRFLKKDPTPAIFSKSPVQDIAEPRSLRSSHHGSQGFAFSRRAQTLNLISRPDRSSATVLSAQFSPDHSLNVRTFLKNTADGPALTALPQTRHSAATPPSDDASVPLARGVSVESDEEDMRRLLDESVGSPAHRIRPGTAGSTKTWNRQTHKVTWSPVASVRRPSPSDPTPPGLSSPFRWAGPAQSPSSPSPHGPSASPSPPQSLVSTSRKDRSPGPQRPPSSTSSQQGALSLEELFPVDRHSDHSHSGMSPASSEEFRINVMGLDDLGFTEETTDKNLCGSPRADPSDGLKEEEVLDYHSDFESVSRTGSCTSPISEHILDQDEEEEELGSEITEKAAGSPLSSQTTEDDPSSSESDTGPNESMRTSNQNQTTRTTQGSGPAKTTRTTPQNGPTEPHGGGCTCGRSLRDPGPEDINNGVPQYVHALSSAHPSTMVLIDMLKQQLSITTRFIERSRRLHVSLVQSLGPPTYTYGSLEDARTSFLKHRPMTTPMEDV